MEDRKVDPAVVAVTEVVAAVVAAVVVYGIIQFLVAV